VGRSLAPHQTGGSVGPHWAGRRAAGSRAVCSFGRGAGFTPPPCPGLVPPIRSAPIRIPLENDGRAMAAARQPAASHQSYMDPRRSFQGLILALQNYWADHGCVILQPYDMEVGAGTFHPATTLRALGPKPWNA